MNTIDRQCHVCGKVYGFRSYEYWDFAKVSKIYQVGYEDICRRCGDKADSFVNYYGKKKPEDKAALRHFLVSGILPMRDFTALTQAGYF